MKNQNAPPAPLQHPSTRPSSVEGGEANTCKLTECRGKPRCEKCLTMDRAYGMRVDARGVIVGIADQPLADAARVLAEFAKTAPGRLPQRVQDAIAVVTADVAATATPQDQAIYDGMAARYQRDRTACVTPCDGGKK